MLLVLNYLEAGMVFSVGTGAVGAVGAGVVAAAAGADLGGRKSGPFWPHALSRLTSTAAVEIA
jgi:hypothetical protein